MTKVRTECINGLEKPADRSHYSLLRSAPHTLRSFGGLRPPHSLRFAFSNNNSHNINMGNSLAS